MDLLLIRHARAEERTAAGADDLRPLTTEGRRRMRKALRGLRHLVPSLDCIAASPLLRAQQTAALVQECYGAAVVTLPALAPGAGADAVTDWLAGQGGDRVALVGHEPDLGRLAVQLLAGAAGDFLPLKKGAVCSIRFYGRAEAGRGELSWLLTSAQLRLLAEVRG